MGVIRKSYEEETDQGSDGSESYTSDCVIVMESVNERLRPPPSYSGCTHRQPPIYNCCDTSTPRSNSWPNEGGRRRGRRGGDFTFHQHNPCHHDRVHHIGRPEPDTGQADSESAKVGCRRDRCARKRCPKCVPCSSYWTRSKMLRAAGHCVLLLLLASCGGFIINSGIGHDDSFSDLAEIVESPLLNNILQPIRISELKRQLQHTKTYYDFLRLFLTKKDASNELIDDIINARTIQKIQRDYDEYEEDYGEDMIMDADVEQERMDEELTQALYHQEEMLNSPLRECKTPHPEIISVIDYENKNRLYFPECTVVHRCRNTSGCCGSNGYECGPKYIEAIERTFLVVDMFDDDKAVPGKDLVEKRIFINHTECECKEKKSLPKCDLFRCPFPFTMRRKGIACSCDCQHFANEVNYLCQGIKDGLMSLAETDLACIKEGTCLKPECTRGSLHIRSGHCPSVDSELISPGQTQYTNKNKHIRHHRGREMKVRELDESELVEADIKPGAKPDVVTDKTTKVTNEVHRKDVVKPSAVTDKPTKITNKVYTKDVVKSSGVTDKTTKITGKIHTSGGQREVTARTTKVTDKIDLENSTGVEHPDKPEVEMPERTNISSSKLAAEASSNKPAVEASSSKPAVEISRKPEMTTTVKPSVIVEPPVEAEMENKVDAQLKDVVVGDVNETDDASKQETNLNMSKILDDVDSDDEDSVDGDGGSGDRMQADRAANTGKYDVDTVKKARHRLRNFHNRHHKKRNFHRRRVHKNKRKQRKHRNTVFHKT